MNAANAKHAAGRGIARRAACSLKLSNSMGAIEYELIKQ